MCLALRTRVPGSRIPAGLAYLHLQKGAEAAAEFRKILDHKGASWGSTWRYPNRYSISYVGVARGSALAGDTASARKAFQDSFAVEGRRPGSHCSGGSQKRLCGTAIVFG
jgi:hypothetical protein